MILTLLLVDTPAALAAAPTISSFHPTSGPIGTMVTIGGTGFQDASIVNDVEFNNIDATFTVVSDVEITATVGAGATDGPLDVTDAEGTATSASNFDVTPSPVPTITSLDPTSATNFMPAQAASGRFQIRCMPGHVAQEDPIVSPGTTSAHMHQFFGNTTTNKDSTYASMIGQPTTCSASADSAGYWVPTVIVDGSVVAPKSILIYYRLRRGARAFRPDLRMVSNRVHKANPDNLIVKFPDCWDGQNLDSSDHMSHMAFSRQGACPVSHPVKVPAITEVFRYPTDVSGATLSSGPVSTLHADFWNTWKQQRLRSLVRRCRARDCGRIGG